MIDRRERRGGAVSRQAGRIEAGIREPLALRIPSTPLLLPGRTYHVDLEALENKALRFMRRLGFLGKRGLACDDLRLGAVSGAVLCEGSQKVQPD